MRRTRALPTVGVLVPVALRAAYGALLLTSPHGLLVHGDVTREPRWAEPIVRVLGARHLAQAGLLAFAPRLGPLGALVDLAHASTDLACAVGVRPLRTPSLLDATVATGLALAALSR